MVRGPWLSLTRRRRRRSPHKKAIAFGVYACAGMRVNAGEPRASVADVRALCYYIRITRCYLYDYVHCRYYMHCIIVCFLFIINDHQRMLHVKR